MICRFIATFLIYVCLLNYIEPLINTVRRRIEFRDNTTVFKEIIHSIIRLTLNVEAIAASTANSQTIAFCDLTRII